ncbi:MAG: DUF1682 domain-containing protein [Lachnospiraceae bacterium]|jgi:hypothetical protein|nr:DUF1682 domain-containing protein [Lachnospiraceae bacterium]
MNGVELGNIYGQMAAGQQKNRPESTGGVRGARTIQEASARYDRAEVPKSGSGSAVSYTRGEPGAGKINYAHMGSRPANAHAENPGKFHFNHAGGHQGANNVPWNLSGKNNNSDLQNPDKTGKTENPLKESGAGGKPVDGANQNNRNNVNNLNSQSTRTGIVANGVGQANNLSMVDRQRLARQKKEKAKAKKKNLNYNRREVSAQVLRASKLGMAARALATARTKASSLRRLVGTGQYDENELRIAIAHAESIVKTAKKKLGNLKEEQIKEKRVSREKQANELKKQVKRQRVRAKRQQIKRELAAQKNHVEQQMKAKEMRCKRLKRRHRGEELADVAKADLKYIKDLQQYRRYGDAGNSSRSVDTTGTAALEIGDTAMRLSDLERAEQALKYEEQQMGQDNAVFSGSSASGTIDFSIGDSSGQISPSGDSVAADVAAVGVAVDVSL